MHTPPCHYKEASTCHPFCVVDPVQRRHHCGRYRWVHQVGGWGSSSGSGSCVILRLSQKAKRTGVPVGPDRRDEGRAHTTWDALRLRGSAVTVGKCRMPALPRTPTVLLHAEAPGPATLGLSIPNSYHYQVITAGARFSSAQLCKVLLSGSTPLGPKHPDSFSFSGWIPKDSVIDRLSVPRCPATVCWCRFLTRGSSLC